MTTEQPSGVFAAEQPPPANPYQDLANAYYAPGGRNFGPVVQAPARSWKGPVVVAVVAVVMLGFGAAYGANEFAKRQVCDSLAVTSTVTGEEPVVGTPVVAATKAETGAAAEEAPNVEELRADIDATRAHAELLVLDADLHDAVDNLMADADSWLVLGEELKTLPDAERAERLPQATSLVTSMDTHLRDVQRACGQTETGLPV